MFESLAVSKPWNVKAHVISISASFNEAMVGIYGREISCKNIFCRIAENCDDVWGKQDYQRNSDKISDQNSELQLVFRDRDEARSLRHGWATCDGDATAPVPVPGMLRTAPPQQAMLREMFEKSVWNTEQANWRYREGSPLCKMFTLKKFR